ncbi:MULTISPECIES: hypothetical protein [Ensifer]|jgi:hypothetical protein|uniref:Uncharacterized protein n=1 Tax=Ensifer canadensis TaxID=555315 RepID=A0AAW4FMM1_9HYPH|nr:MULTISPECIES: hypothetical protein [Ensifer]MDP9632307.1 hypothetical protein [Ensifer adhaerens]KQU74014.1 hypothetical protein ASD00_11585 [Ensifer sp. Root31]KQW58468.1 hypothetical protein ASD02_05515 [Ensifer sp. Root1252]KQW62427.1 hypothetical protein ASD03_13615 [Ensifer sp. Root127]KQY78442.1 hypothetical protein ASD52_00810 [Ensifer sp. Root142]
MTMSVRKLIAALSVTTLIAGAAGPVLADSYYQGIDANNPPGTQYRARVAPMRTTVAPVDRMSTGSIYRTVPRAYQQPLTDRYQGGDGDYYQGIVPPTY